MVGVKNMKIKKSIGSKSFDVFNILLMIVLALVTLYPCYYVLVASVSDPSKFYDGSALVLWPRGLGFGGYEAVLKNNALWVSYRNTIIYVVLGTILSVLMTTSAAYSLSRKRLKGRNIVMLLITFTMYFSGGMIPTYIVVRNLGIINTPLAMILPNAVIVYNLIITLSYFRSIPDSLEEAARIDGAGALKTFWKIMLPLAAPIVAVISLYYAVGIWNDYMSGLLYITKPELKPLQMVLRDILLQEGGAASAGSGDVAAVEEAAYAANIRYATIVVSTVPILCIYPFIQRYFIKGVMIGAVKG